MLLDPVLRNGTTAWTSRFGLIRPLNGVLLAAHAFVPVSVFHARLAAAVATRHRPHVPLAAQPFWSATTEGRPVVAARPLPGGHTAPCPHAGASVVLRHASGRTHAPAPVCRCPEGAPDQVPDPPTRRMPERPDLEYQRDLLHTGVRCGGDRRGGAQPHRGPKAGREDAAALVGRTVGVERQSHFMVFGLDGPAPALEVAIHPMLAGRFQLCPAQARVTKDTCFAFTFEDGRQLRYRDRKQMGKVYIAPTDKRTSIPGLASIGLDVLAPNSPSRLLSGARRRRDQVKVFLMDKSALDAFGNAYADETLFAAGIHPKARVRELSDAQLHALHQAAITVLREACETIRERQPPLHEKVRDFLKVRNRKGEPCPTCDAPIRVAGVRGHDAFFCAVCQPDQKGRGFVRWRR